MLIRSPDLLHVCPGPLLAHGSTAELHTPRSGRIPAARLPRRSDLAQTANKKTSPSYLPTPNPRSQKSLHANNSASTLDTVAAALLGAG